MASGLVMGALGDDPGPAWTFGGKPVPDLFQGNPCVDWSQSDPALSLIPGYLAAMRDAALMRPSQSICVSSTYILRSAMK